MKKYDGFKTQLTTYLNMEFETLIDINKKGLEGWYIEEYNVSFVHGETVKKSQIIHEIKYKKPIEI
jgi:hypothetical protein